MENQFTAISIFLLAAGVFFGFGEMLALEYSFFTSSSVTDFFAKTAKIGWVFFPAVILISGASYVKAKLFNGEIEKSFYNRLEDTVKLFTTNLIIQGVTIFVVIAAGYLSIAWQNSKTIDATVFLKNEEPLQTEIRGNLLATNSAVIAMYSRNKLYLIPIENVERIQYEKSIYVRTRLEN